jgi:deoxyadenosine/deoxycytidine kinase
MTTRFATFVALSGNIGSGKTTLTRLLSDRLGCRPYYEAVDENPYLADFYDDMPRWSFHLQVCFLTRRFHHHQQIQSAPHPAIQDRTIYEDVEIFARNLYLQGLMSDRDFGAYMDLYAVMTPHLRPPDLVIYLRAPVEVLLDRIAARARAFERTIPASYLTQLNDRYDEWAARFDLCPMVILDAERVDLARLDEVAAQVAGHLPSPIARAPRGP